jgi:opacity protein-like surface antigen
MRVFRAFPRPRGAADSPLASDLSSPARIAAPAGAGVEWKFSGPWSAKLEYLHMDFGQTAHFTTAGHTPEEIDLKVDLIRAGVNYSFGPALGRHLKHWRE